MHQEWKTNPWFQTSAQREQKEKTILRGCLIAMENVDSGRGLDFQGHVLVESVMKLRGYTLETQM